LWYIIPAEMVVGQGSIALYPKLKTAKYGPYKEAWHLLRNEEAKPSRVGWIEASVEEMPWGRAPLGERIWRRLWAAGRRMVGLRGVELL
jgi:hypothetical protein